MKHNKLNVERESEGVNRGFFLDIWIGVNSIANRNCRILWKIGYATAVKRKRGKRGETLSSEIKLGFTDIINWHLKKVINIFHTKYNQEQTFLIKF
jgi:hypothetical protein